jgi:hypothetical protein
VGIDTPPCPEKRFTIIPVNLSVGSDHKFHEQITNMPDWNIVIFGKISPWLYIGRLQFSQENNECIHSEIDVQEDSNFVLENGLKRN